MERRDENNSSPERNVPPASTEVPAISSDHFLSEEIYLETFTEARVPVDNPNFKAQRKKVLESLSDGMIDPPIVDIINTFNWLPYCFTLQCCCGHFLFKGQEDQYHLGPLPIDGNADRVYYRIAYLAICVENSQSGKCLIEGLRRIAEMDKSNIQFGSADWFWQRQVNSYVLQIEPDRFKYEDSAELEYREALDIQKTRNSVFAGIREWLEEEIQTAVMDVKGF